MTDMFFKFPIDNNNAELEVEFRRSSTCHTNTALSTDGSLSEYMWDETESERTRTLNSAFIKNLRDGTLDPTAFGVFNLQDIVYLNESAVSWKIAASRESNSLIREFMDLQHAKSTKYAKAILTEWHSLNASDIQLGEAMTGYVAFERHVAETMDPIYFIAANIPCYKLWPWIGTQTDFAKSGVYKKWAENNFRESHSYKVLENYVNEAYEEGQIEASKAVDVYKTCMGYEMEFFETAVILSTNN